MKRLYILFVLFAPLFLCAQNVPVIETEIDTYTNFELTDAQLAADETLAKTYEKYSNKDYQLDTTAITPQEWIGINKALKTLNLETLWQYMDGPTIWASQEFGCSWYCGAGHYQTVSSSLPSTAKNNYSAESIFDDDVRTAWVEGAKGYGIGEYVSVHFPANFAAATDGYIVNGYNKNERTWRNNSRVKTMNLYIDDKFVATLNLKDTRQLQHFTLPDTIPNMRDTTAFSTFKSENGELKVSTLKFLITDVYKGDKYDDTAISELYFDGIGVHCIAEGAAVMMSDKSTKRIERVKVGDTVLGYDEDGTFAAKKVTAVHTVMHRTMYKIRLKDGKTIVVTDDHPFLSNSGWKSLNPLKTKGYPRYLNKQVSKLEEGNTIKVLLGDADSTSSEVIEIDEVNAKINTYTLELEDNSTFIANGILVGQE